MSKLVILEIGRGSFEEGFPVRLEIRDRGKLCAPQISGELSAAPQLPQLYQNWQNSYYAWGQQFRWLSRNHPQTNSHTRTIEVPPQNNTNVSYDDLEEQANDAAFKLEEAFNQWLDRSSITKIREEVLQTVLKQEDVQFVIQSENRELQQFPWERWSWLIKRYLYPEVALSSRKQQEKGALSIPVKILAILGSDENIEIQTDWQILQDTLPRAQLKLLKKPSPETFRDTLRNEAWDIVFFAGHSSTGNDGNDGIIWLNDRDCLSPRQIETALERSVQNGLKLAIFNSCDGLGLARQLDSLGIPHIIVMREPIHDEIAQKFLQDFLTNFAEGMSLHQAVGEARDRLKLLEHYSPKASWMPVIFQNPEESPLYYPIEEPIKSPKPSILFIKKKKVLWAIALFVLALITFLAVIAFDRFIFHPDAQWREGISLGEEILIEHSNSPPQKEAGRKAFAQKDYPTAKKFFAESLASFPNDPEAKIYYNNAKATDYSQKALKIAVGVPIGTNPEVAEEILRGVALAQEDINNESGMEGVNGRRIQIAIANDDNDKDLAAKVAARFVKDRNILAVVGHNASNASSGAMPVYLAGKLVAISPTSFTEKLQSDVYIYRMVPQITAIADKLSNYIIKTDAQPHVAICFDPDAPDNEYYKKQFEQTLGGSYSFEIPCELKNLNFNPLTVVDAVVKNKADSLMVAPHIDRIAKAIDIFKAIRDRKLPITLFGSPSLNTYKTIALGKEAVENLILSTPWYPNKNDEFSKRSKEVWGAQMFVWRSPMAYDATLVIAEGLKKVLDNKKEASRQQLDRVLRDADFVYQKGATGITTFDPKTGERNFAANKERSEVLIQIENGEFVRFIEKQIES
jgi:branched-chain amino acid transport system substrate-binding protein